MVRLHKNCALCFVCDETLMWSEHFTYDDTRTKPLPHNLDVKEKYKSTETSKVRNAKVHSELRLVGNSACLRSYWHGRNRGCSLMVQPGTVSTTVCRPFPACCASTALCMAGAWTKLCIWMHYLPYIPENKLGNRTNSVVNTVSLHKVLCQQMS